MFSICLRIARAPACMEAPKTTSGSTSSTRRLPSLTTDAGVLRQKDDGALQVLLITRKHDPFAGCFAFPGGFVDYNEDPRQGNFARFGPATSGANARSRALRTSFPHPVGCLRELVEETSLVGTNATVVNVYGNPSRDVRALVC